MTQQQHPNQMESPWFPTNKTRAQLLQEQRGTIINANYLPYYAELVDIEMDPAGGQYRQVVRPASIVLVEAYWKKMGTYQEKVGVLEVERRIMFARKVTATIWQEAWDAGVPLSAVIYCAACQETRPAHGSNSYDSAGRLCNRCVGEVEELMAQEAVFNVAEWVTRRSTLNILRSRIREIELHGEGILPLPDGRILELFPLYRFIRHSLYKDVEREHEESWPYGDMRPVMYQGYVRSNWRPGEFFNNPDDEVIFTTDDTLLNFLQTGELPKGGRNPRRK